jgi:tRNA (cytidine/uridine-2'-O-)-methyltransferase
LFALSTHGTRNFAEVEFRVDDAFVFGPETRGLGQDLLEEFPAAMRLKLPMLPGNRSLNLSNAVAVVVFEAWRQIGFLGSA